MSSKRNDGWSDFDSPLIEILSLVAGQINEPTGERVPCGILTARLHPKDTHATSDWLIRREQLVRLRDDINKLLNDPQSWLHVPGDSGEIPKTPEGFAHPLAAFNSPLDPDQAARHAD